MEVSRVRRTLGGAGIRRMDFLISTPGGRVRPESARRRRRRRRSSQGDAPAQQQLGVRLLFIKRQ